VNAGPMPWRTGGFWVTALLTLGGAWLLVAPRCIGYQAAGVAWLAATRSDVAAGAVLAGSGLLGMFAQVAFALGDLVRAAGQTASVAPNPGASEDA
jgi:hypothetical protein